MRLRVPFACRPGCALCADVVLAGSAPPVADLRTRLEHAEQTGQGRVYVQGTDVADGPHLEMLLSAKPRSLQVGLVEQGLGLDLPARARALQRMGIAHVYVSLRGAAAVPREGKVPSQDPRKQTLAVVLALGRAADLAAGLHVPFKRGGGRTLPQALRLQPSAGAPTASPDPRTR